MLSLTVDQGILAQTGAEDRREESDNKRSSSAMQLPSMKQRGKGKRRATNKESSNSKLLTLVKEINEEIRERDEHIREELRWRDNHLEDQIKKRENLLTTAL